MTEPEARKKANLLVLNDAQEVYDACDHVGQIKDNVPRWFLVDIVTRLLVGDYS